MQSTHQYGLDSLEPRTHAVILAAGLRASKTKYPLALRRDPRRRGTPAPRHGPTRCPRPCVKPSISPKESEFMAEVLGEQVFEQFLAKRADWDQYQSNLQCFHKQLSEP